MKNEIIMSYVLPPPSIQVYIQHFSLMIWVQEKWPSYYLGKWVYYLVFILERNVGGGGRLFRLLFIKERERDMSGILWRRGRERERERESTNNIDNWLISFVLRDDCFERAQHHYTAVWQQLSVSEFSHYLFLYYLFFIPTQETTKFVQQQILISTE